MRILITGSNGFLASNFIRMHNKRFKKIIGISKSKNKYLYKNYKHYSFDINDLFELKKILKKEKPNIFLLAASNSIVGESEINPIETLRTNTFSQAEIYEIIRKIDNKIIIISLESILLYGNIVNKKKNKLKEDNNAKPSNTYQYSKYLLSNISNLYRNNYNLKIYSLRPASLFGPEDLQYSRIIPKSIKNILNNKNLVLYSGVSNFRREFLFVEDLCDIILRIILNNKKIKPDFYNVGSNQVFTIRELLKLIIKKTKSNSKIQIKKNDGEFTKISHLVLDSSKLQKYLNFQFTDFSAALKKTIKFYKNN